MTLLENKRIAIQFLEFATAYRIDECLAMLAPDATWWVLGDPTRLKVAGSKDRAQIGRLLGRLAKMVPQAMQLTIRGTTAQGSRVAVEAECTGRWRNGTKYDNRYHFLFEIQDGSVISVREYMDTLHLFESMALDASINANS